MFAFCLLQDSRKEKKERPLLILRGSLATQCNGYLVIMVTIMTQSCPLPTLRLPIVIYGDHKVISCDPKITAKTKISVSSRSRFKF